MDTLTATYSVVTPMFLGGAEPTSEAELRLPSFKGALRFWWRALMWGRVGDIEELRKREAVLFGSSETGQSRVLMRLRQPLSETNTMPCRWPASSWERYTGYGIRDKGERCFIKCGREFTIEFNLRRCSRDQADQIIAAAKLFGLVGGLGSRSRKGWGSVTLTALEGAPWACPGDATSWEKAVGSLRAEPLPTNASHCAFTANSLWKVGPEQTDSASAQRWLGKRYQDHVKATQPKRVRAQFGLPRMFRRGTQPRKERRASPLLLHVHECPSRRALPCALWLPADFLPTTPDIPGDGSRARQFVEDLTPPSA
jgi:CRISPR-associated protein Cmr1